MSGLNQADFSAEHTHHRRLTPKERQEMRELAEELARLAGGPPVTADDFLLVWKPEALEELRLEVDLVHKKRPSLWISEVRKSKGI